MLLELFLKIAKPKEHLVPGGISEISVYCHRSTLLFHYNLRLLASLGYQSLDEAEMFVTAVFHVCVFTGADSPGFQHLLGIYRLANAFHPFCQEMQSGFISLCLAGPSVYFPVLSSCSINSPTFVQIEDRNTRRTVEEKCSESSWAYHITEFPRGWAVREQDDTWEINYCTLCRSLKLRSTKVGGELQVMEATRTISGPAIWDS